MACLNNPISTAYEFPPQKVSWLKRDLLVFANTIGCVTDELHFLFELHPKFAAFPTYPVVLPFKWDDQEVSDTLKRISHLQKTPGGPPLDVSRYMDAERYITLLKALPVTSAGRSFTLNQKCCGIYDKGKHTVQVFETLLVDSQSGEVYARFTSSGIALGQGGWGGPKGHSPIRYPAPDNRKADHTLEMSVSEGASLLYRLNGDYHPHNVDSVEAQRSGFLRPFLPGLATWNMTAHALLRALCNSDPARLRVFGARFTGVVFPGDRLTLEIWKLRPGELGKSDECGSHENKENEWEEVRFRVKVEMTIVMSDGRAVVNLWDLRDARSKKL